MTPLKGTGYRLPTEAEWEYASRGGTTTRYWSGDNENDLLRVGWYAGNSGTRTHPVAELQANPFGLFDVHGNVAEWVQDSWDPAMYEAFNRQAAVDPYKPFSDDNFRVIRGGSWQDNGSITRMANRLPNSFVYSAHRIGFRVVLMVDSPRLDGSKPAR
ncbi:MAG: formylglycine-generating enzyme family protein [Planctomycetaceae bacterium]|nr:formylglycine-generating enzyme family protein [Planctomycetaceae bacterium]